MKPEQQIVTSCHSATEIRLKNGAKQLNAQLKNGAKPKSPNSNIHRTQYIRDLREPK